MASVIMTCGRLCCGKSTYAERLRREKNGIILSADELMLTLFPDGAGESHDLLVGRAQDYLLRRALDIVRAGTDVILDWGFWTRASRDAVRAFWARHGVPCAFHGIRVDAEEWRRRIRMRNASVEAGGKGAYYVDEGLLRKAEALFEEPDPGEMDLWVDG